MATAQTTLAIDGLLDESEWEDAQRFDDFKVTQPLTLATPPHRTQARVLSLREGLAVAIIAEQPVDAPRIKPKRSRDANPMEADRATIIIDFDGTSQRAYEFTISLGGTQRDGTVSNETQFNYDWDGRWQAAVQEDTEGWTAEFLIPWTVVPMRDAGDTTRQLAVYFSRVVTASGQRYGWPAVNSDRSRYVSDFARIQVAAQHESAFDVIPYASTQYDFVGDRIETKAGLDLFWKPNSRLQLNAALKPDFGQVESDDLVVNFDAIETYLTDKRPFFTENQALFDLRTPKIDGVADQLLYTRRIGGPADDGSGRASDIDAALKLSGAAGGIDYGAFAAAEGDEAGRDYYAVRALRPGTRLSLGYLATYVDRPALRRSAWVNAVDWRWQPDAANTVQGMLIRSDVHDASSPGNARRSGDGAFITWLFALNPHWQQEAGVQHYDRTLDFNDAGFQRRNSLNRLFFSGTYRQTAFKEGSRNATVAWNANTTYLTNDSGDRLPQFTYFSRKAERVGGGLHYTELRYDAPGYDDLIARGHGLVRRRTRWDFWHYYTSPQLGPWKYTLGAWLFQEGLDGHAFQLEPEISYQVSERLDFNLFWYPRWSRDWLVWREDTLLASYERLQNKVGLDINWFPATKHELRLKAQWLVFDARNATPYRIGDGGRLYVSGESVPDLSARNFGLQIRYRYEFSPQRDLYVVYARGGYAEDEGHDRHAARLFLDASRLRDSDQVLVKLRWRL
jgi:uncharacterized protein DUF5916